MQRLLRPVITAILLLATPLAIYAQSTTSSATIVASQFSGLTSFIGATPQRVYETFGRPAESHVERFCCRIGSYSGDNLVHVYNAEGGGVIAFLYGKYTQGILVNGVVFDNLDAVQFWQLADFFPNGAPRSSPPFQFYVRPLYRT